ncbi:DUF4113 domain-containing protein [bacterium SGD-2]|nr:DUF4113 domain-containing protein [bacterium SGD-2]
MCVPRALTAAWQMRQERMSPSYTTRWDDLVEVWR